MKKKRILVAVLNWGLGHATRCVPIIRELEKRNFEPVIASDGSALELLKKEFPGRLFETLPSYNIEYSEKPNLLKWKLFLESPRIIKAIKTEKEVTQKLVEKHNLKGIISDNRLGVRYKYLKSVFITHQLNVLSGNTTWLSSKLHQKYIRKFDECWVPDYEGSKNLSGNLGHLKNKPEHVKYLGALSRFEKLPAEKKYDILILLSGPEPQRSFLEEILLKSFKTSDKTILFLRGLVDDNLPIPNSTNPNLHIENYLFGEQLELALNESDLVICRSGYTSIMDLAKLGKKAFFIPTPGQFEQEYLAERFMKLGIAPFCRQEDFSLEKLKSLKDFSGFVNFGIEVSFSGLFSLFEGK